MKKYIILFGFLMLNVISYGQTIKGEYYWEGELQGPNYNYLKLKIEILNDSTFIQTENTAYKEKIASGGDTWKQTVKNGKILKTDEFNMLMTEEEPREFHLVKFNRKNLIIYGFKKNWDKNPRQLKGIKLKKASR